MCISETTFWWIIQTELIFLGRERETDWKDCDCGQLKDKDNNVWLWAGRILAVGWDQIERSTHHLSTTATNTTTTTLLPLLPLLLHHLFVSWSSLPETVTTTGHHRMDNQVVCQTRVTCSVSYFQTIIYQEPLVVCQTIEEASETRFVVYYTAVALVSSVHHYLIDQSTTCLYLSLLVSTGYHHLIDLSTCVLLSTCLLSN